MEHIVSPFLPCYGAKLSHGQCRHQSRIEPGEQIISIGITLPLLFFEGVLGGSGLCIFLAFTHAFAK